VPPQRVGAAHLVLTDNRFRDDSRGVVLLGLDADIARNTFEGAANEALYASTGRLVASDNTFRTGRGFGIYLERIGAARVEHNVIANNCAGGIMAREVSNVQLERNHLYQNGHGIVMMEGSALTPNSIRDNLVADDEGDGIVLIGAAVQVVGNRVLYNRRTGLHVSAITDSRGGTKPGRLFVERNVLTGNGRDEDHDVYRPDTARTATRGGQVDCDWRRNATALVALREAPQ
jgi:nitrous oxidase accessory protein NosD